MRQPTRPLAALTLAAAVAGLAAGGCSSTDRHVFTSTYSDPATVSVLDLSTKTELWRKPIPPGSKLVVDLDRDAADNPFATNGIPASSLEWQLFAPKSGMVIYGYPGGEATESGRAKLPGQPVILVYQLASEGDRGVYRPSQPAASGPNAPFGETRENPPQATPPAPEPAAEPIDEPATVTPAPEPMDPAPAASPAPNANPEPPAPADPVSIEDAVEPEPNKDTPAPPATPAEPDMNK